MINIICHQSFLLLVAVSVVSLLASYFKVSGWTCCSSCRCQWRSSGKDGKEKTYSFISSYSEQSKGSEVNRSVLWGEERRGGHTAMNQSADRKLSGDRVSMAEYLTMQSLLWLWQPSWPQQLLGLVLQQRVRDLLLRRPKRLIKTILGLMSSEWRAASRSHVTFYQPPSELRLQHWARGSSKDSVDFLIILSNNSPAWRAPLTHTHTHLRYNSFTDHQM